PACGARAAARARRAARASGAVRAPAAGATRTAAAAQASADGPPHHEHGGRGALLAGLLAFRIACAALHAVHVRLAARRVHALGPNAFARRAGADAALRARATAGGAVA